MGCQEILGEERVVVKYVAHKFPGPLFHGDPPVVVKTGSIALPYDHVPPGIHPLNQKRSRLEQVVFGVCFFSRSIGGSMGRR